MKNRTLFFVLSALGLALASAPLGGCSYLKAREARNAYAEYQEALAIGDTARARKALLALVRADEDVSDYWLELGRLQIRIGDYRGAYDAFSRAHELDRSNVDVLAAMTQIALMAGETDIAKGHARSLALVAPDNPVVTLVNGFVDLRAGDLDKASAAADNLLSSAPTDPFAKILKARVLIASHRIDDATALLEEQHRTVPEDANTTRALSELYRARQDWRNLARVQLDMYRFVPKDTAIRRSIVEAFLRAGDVGAASKMSVPMVSPTADPRLVEATLALWARYAPDGAVLPDAVQRANAVRDDRRVSFANYFNAIKQPHLAEALLGSSRLPVSHANARWNAVFAQSQALQGRVTEAKMLLDKVLDEEPDQVEALRGRVTLMARTGQSKQAVIDALRLVTISPDNGDDRLLLAQAYLADGNRREVRRTLWQAIHDLPDDGRVYSALKGVLASSGDQDSLRRVDQEVADRRMAKLTKELI